MIKIGLLTLVLVASAFANVPHLRGKYTGKGEWAMPDGGKGTWTSVMTIEDVEKGARIHEVLTVHTPDKADHVEESKWQAAFRGNGFFDITRDGKTTGWGHCFGKLCQLNGTGKDGAKYAETLSLSPKGIYRIGFEQSDKYRVTWKGSMAKN